MSEIGDLLVESWAVRYGDGSETEKVTIPHAWRQDIPLSDEGPVEYRTTIDVPRVPSKLRFGGVSYACEVTIDNERVTSHRGIWDSFDVSLTRYAGRRVPISVSVVKNGGPTYPVKEVASGFLPYVFHTFGGLFGEVFLIEEDAPLSLPAPARSRIEANGSKISVDGEPFYPRGLLHWGWYPDLGHTNPPGDLIKREVREARRLGFNLVKFCLWVPPHRYLEILKEEGMEAWIELPIWRPSMDSASLNQIADEVERTVRQYRHHDNVLFWTVGCELGGAVSSDFRSRLTQLVKNLACGSLVKDSSGGAEMFGGDLQEFGDFYDFHPYCDTQFYPEILDVLMPGPRRVQPLLLGEFNDIDVHRDLELLGNEIPYWASNLSELNDKGARWQYDLPGVLSTNRFALNPAKELHRSLMENSRRKAVFVRKTAQEAVRARSAISGYVVNGLRDTPISSSGFFDDWGIARFAKEECSQWNGPSCLFMIPWRCTPWVSGGNRSGFMDPCNLFTGHIRWKIGIHSDRALNGGLVWRVLDGDGNVAHRGAEPFVQVHPLISTEIAEIQWECRRPGTYRLEVEFPTTTNSWPIWVTEPLENQELAQWAIDDPLECLGIKSHDGPMLLTTRLPVQLRPGLVTLTTEGSKPMPFWRESAYEFNNERFWELAPFKNEWARLLPISPDRVIDEGWLNALNIPYEILLRRIDVPTYKEHPVAVRVGETIITTLRPFGGLGTQPSGLPNNPAGGAFLKAVHSFLR